MLLTCELFILVVAVIVLEEHSTGLARLVLVQVRLAVRTCSSLLSTATEKSSNTGLMNGKLAFTCLNIRCTCMVQKPSQFSILYPEWLQSKNYESL
jgi:hypothetical protein